jgi:uncharacterized membrane protein
MVVIFSKDNTQFYNTVLKKYQKYNMDGKNKTQQEKVDKYYQTILSNNTTTQYYQAILPSNTTTQYYQTILPHNTTNRGMCS